MYWLTDEQVRALTKKRSRPAQLRVLRELGYSYRVRPDGSFIVPTDQFAAPGERAATYRLDFSGLGNA